MQCYGREAGGRPTLQDCSSYRFPTASFNQASLFNALGCADYSTLQRASFNLFKLCVLIRQDNRETRVVFLPASDWQEAQISKLKINNTTAVQMNKIPSSESYH